MTLESFNRYRERYILSSFICVPAAIDCISRTIEVEDEGYHQLYLKHQEVQRVGTPEAIQEFYSLVNYFCGLTPDSWMAPAEYSADYFRTMISAGYRVLGNFVGTGHTVGLTYDSNSDKFSFVGVEIPRSDGSFVNDPVVIDDLDPYINGFLKNGGYIRILPPG